ncbi:hypothetical protein ABT301_09840 [Streptomyces sp. NPDC000987]|uniref:hypothetical protein n=1 Tax=Streptomyces sp. NPDC000987 TaxID=3154374 RepID=UPI003328ACAD
MKRRLFAGACIAAAAGLAGTATMAINADAAWTSARNGSAPGWFAADSPQVSVDRQGEALRACTAGDLSTTYTGARLISRSGAFGAAKTLTSDGRVPQVDVRPSSRFTVI